MKKLEGKDYEQPTMDTVSASHTLPAGDNKPGVPGAAENKEWMRWNHCGIALIDARPYPASVSAFEHKPTLRPDYSDAYTNVAIAGIQWEKYENALPSFRKAYFIDQKDDPTARVYALQYLRKHHDGAQKSMLWHVQCLNHAGSSIAHPAAQSMSFSVTIP